MDQLIGNWVQDAVVDGRVVNTSMASIERSEDGFVVIRSWLEGPAPARPTARVGRELAVPDDDGDRRRWRWWRDQPGFNQRFEGVVDGDTITGTIEMSEDGSNWRKDVDVV